MRRRLARESLNGAFADREMNSKHCLQLEYRLPFSLVQIAVLSDRSYEVMNTYIRQVDAVTSFFQYDDYLANQPSVRSRSSNIG